METPVRAIRTASGLMTVEQVSTLFYCIGEEAETVLTSAGITDEEMAVYDTVIVKFDVYFSIRRNVTFEQALQQTEPARKGNGRQIYH